MKFYGLIFGNDALDTSIENINRIVAKTVMAFIKPNFDSVVIHNGSKELIKELKNKGIPVVEVGNPSEVIMLSSIAFVHKYEGSYQNLLQVNRSCKINFI